MDRREVIMAAGGALLAGTVGTAFAAEKEHKHDSGMLIQEDLARSAADCARTGQTTLRLSINLLEKGDISMAECGRTVQDLVATCEAMMKMASFGSRHIGPMAKVVRGVCIASEKICMKHKEHKECVECAKSCRECANICKKYI
ncbi:MAG: Csp1 family four helix bundle copper storage protein [Nitrospinota bacterium]|nr:Csp1 family four helix bundle copper storage protein [Nitrospinota bacterium]